MTEEPDTRKVVLIRVESNPQIRGPTIMQKLEMESLINQERVTVTAAAEAVGVTPAAFSNLKKRKTSESYVKMVGSGFNPKRRRLRLGLYPTMENQLLEWIAKANSMIQATNITLSAHLIKTMAVEFAGRLGIKGFVASNGWWEGFRSRWNIESHKFHGEGGQVDVVAAAAKVADIYRILEGIPPERVYNMDETGLNFR